MRFYDTGVYFRAYPSTEAHFDLSIWSMGKVSATTMLDPLVATIIWSCCRKETFSVSANRGHFHHELWYGFPWCATVAFGQSGPRDKLSQVIVQPTNFLEKLRSLALVDFLVTHNKIRNGNICHQKMHKNPKKWAPCKGVFPNPGLFISGIESARRSIWSYEFRRVADETQWGPFLERVNKFVRWGVNDACLVARTILLYNLTSASKLIFLVPTQLNRNLPFRYQ